MSIGRTSLLLLLCAALVGCQQRPVLVPSPPTPTAQRPAAATTAPPAPTVATPRATAPPTSAGTPGIAAKGSVAGAPAPVTPAPAATPADARAPRPSACAYAASRRMVEVQERGLKEASGLAASQRWPVIYWAINDSGNTPSVYAIDEQGRSRGAFRVEDARNEDWEAVQIGPGRDGGPALYLADIGDNDAERREVMLYRVPEPEPAPPGARSGNARTAPAEAFKLQYPRGARDAEALLVHPTTGEILIVTKEVPGRAAVYRVPRPLDGRRTLRLDHVADLDMAQAGVKIDVVTDAAVSPDARRVTLRTYGSFLEYDVPEGAPLASIWAQHPRAWSVEDGPQGEGITYRADGGALISIGESMPTYLYEAARQC